MAIIVRVKVVTDSFCRTYWGRPLRLTTYETYYELNYRVVGHSYELQNELGDRHKSLYSRAVINPHAQIAESGKSVVRFRNSSTVRVSLNAQNFPQFTYRLPYPATPRHKIFHILVRFGSYQKRPVPARRYLVVCMPPADWTLFLPARPSRQTIVWRSVSIFVFGPPSPPFFASQFRAVRASLINHKLMTRACIAHHDLWWKGGEAGARAIRGGINVDRTRFPKLKIKAMRACAFVKRIKTRFALR